mgnify:CR=1 FL=1
MEKVTTKLRRLLAGPGCVVAPGVADGLAARLVKLSVLAPEQGPALADQAPSAALTELDPREVFLRCYRRRHPDDPGARPSEALSAAFDELLVQVSEIGRAHV